MSRPKRLTEDAISAWMSTHPGWERVKAGAAGADALACTFRFDDFGAALGFVVRVGCAAEKRDHHPDVELGWGRARVIWSTHDAGGITELDLELAEKSSALARGTGERAS